MRCSSALLSLSLALASLAAADYPDQMVVVPAGIFIMGDGTAWCGADEREVTLTRPFCLGQHEVTNQEYLEAVQWAFEHGYVTATTASVRDNLDESTEELLDLDNSNVEIQFDGAGTFTLREAASGHVAYPGGYDPAHHPVKEVTWYGAVRFCDWLSLQAGLPRAYEHSGDWSCNGGDPYGAAGYRLPTDAEWEYAAQFDDERIYAMGNELPNCSRANYSRESFHCVGWTTPVGSYPDAPEALGLSDMGGNVFEWCNDWHVCDLGTTAAIDPPGPTSGAYRVVHGSSWNYYSFLMRNSARDPYPGISNDRTGLRVAKTGDPAGIGDRPPRPRSKVTLEGNRPNPFTHQTRITYSIPDEARGASVLLAVHDAAGRVVRTLVSGEARAGHHIVTWNGANESGDPVPAGAYYYRLTIGEESQTKALLLVR